MNASRESDKLIAEEVLQFKNVHWNDCTVEVEGTEHIGGIYRNALVYQPYDDCETLFREVPQFTSSISAAWEVIEYLRKKNIGVEILPSEKGYYVSYLKKLKHGWISMGQQEESEMASLAICMAALKVIKLLKKYPNYGE